MARLRLADVIVNAILRDLSGRKGVGDELDALDPDIRDELRAALVTTVEIELASY